MVLFRSDSERNSSDSEETDGFSDSSSDSQRSERRRSSRSRRRKRNERHDAEAPPSSSSKRLRREDHGDRISKLPDCLLVYILSRLPTKDAVKTTLLSKRWFEIWTFTTQLDFHFGRSSSYRDDPFRVVSSILMFHKRLNLENFAVRCHSDRYRGSKDVDLWVRLMTSAKVRDLTLEFLNDYDDENDYYYSDEGDDDDDEAQHLTPRRFYADFDVYTLPRHLYTNTCLTNLRISMCRVKPDGEIRWDSLKSLAIGHTVLDDIHLKRVLECSPLLEALELYHFGGIKKITSDKLIVLIIRDDRYYRTPQKNFVVSAPNLQSLTVTGDVCWKSFRVLNANSLIHCRLDFSARYDFVDNGQARQQNLLKGVMGDLRRVKELNIGPPCIAVLARMEIEGASAPTCHRCKLLTLETSLSNLDVPGIARLLRSSFHLEELIINLPISSHPELPDDSDDPVPNEENYWTSRGINFSGLFRIKRIRIRGVSRRNSGRYVFPLVQFLMKNARVLELLALEPAPGLDKKSCQHEGCQPKVFVEMLHKLLSFPRLSPHAVITFRPA